MNSFILSIFFTSFVNPYPFPAALQIPSNSSFRRPLYFQTFLTSVSSFTFAILLIANHDALHLVKFLKKKKKNFPFFFSFCRYHSVCCGNCTKHKYHRAPSTDVTQHQCACININHRHQRSYIHLWNVSSNHQFFFFSFCTNAKSC